MKRNKTALVIWLLILVILILLVLVAYVFLVRPALTNYALDRQNEGVEFAIASVMQAAAQCQPVPLTYNNQTINLVAMECPAIQACLQQQAPEQQPAA